MTYTIYAHCVSRGVRQVLYKKDCWHKDNHSLFNSKSPPSGYSSLSLMDEKCMKFPAVLFANYYHQCLPPELAQTLTACPLGLGLTQLLPTAPLQTGAWLSYTTPGELPLSCSISPRVPSGWRKMYSPPGSCCHRHLNSNHSSFLPRPRRSAWPRDWKRTRG